MEICLASVCRYLVAFEESGEGMLYRHVSPHMECSGIDRLFLNRCFLGHLEHNMNS